MTVTDRMVWNQLLGDIVAASLQMRVLLDITEHVTDGVDDISTVDVKIVTLGEEIRPIGT